MLAFVYISASLSSRCVELLRFHSVAVNDVKPQKLKWLCLFLSLKYPVLVAQFWHKMQQHTQQISKKLSLYMALSLVETWQHVTKK